MIRRLITLSACIGLLILFWQPLAKLVAQSVESASSSKTTGENRNNVTISEQVAFSCSNVTEIPQTECEALVALYNSTNGPNWRDHSGWLTTITPCSWFGVNCLNNHVYFLNLANNQLSGALPPQIGDFPDMLGIYMENNLLNGNIPTQLSNLPKLIDLRLSSNQFSGSIPAQLGNLPTLYYLYLDNNQLSGSIPAQLGNRTGLIGLNLCCNQLSGNVPTQLGNLTELKALNLENNGALSGALPGTLTNLSKLTTFWFHNTSLCEPNDNTFQTWLAGITNLNRTGIPCTARPSAEFDAWPQIGPASLTVSMHIVSVANITSCVWEYDDGQTGNSCASYHDHVYSAAGIYTVKLTVSGLGGSDTKTRLNYITVTAPPVNTPPEAYNQNVTTPQNTAKNITLTASDSDDDPLTYILTSNPTHGSLNGTPPTLTYTPNTNSSGSDSFTFKVNDGKVDSNIATVNITVTPVAICYTLVTSVNPSSGGTITSSPQPNCQGDKYQQGTVVSFSVSASSGYAFSHWSGTSSGNTNPLMITMNGDKRIIANFNQIVSSPTVQFSAATYTVLENNGFASIEVTLSTTSERAITVNYSTSGNTATADSDYSEVNSTLTFNPSETRKSFTVPIIDDTLDEADETINLLLNNPTNAILDPNSNAVLTIIDNEIGTWSGTSRISVASEGMQGNDFSSSPSISSNGRYVVFYSRATNLVDNDTNNIMDVFLHDRTTGQTTRVSVASDGIQANGYSTYPVISADGRYIAFASAANNLVSNDTNGKGDVFIYDQLLGKTTRVSVASDGSQGNGESSPPSISSDGRYIAFGSTASNLVPGDNNQVRDTFVHDHITGETTRVSIASDGTQGNANAGPISSSISADGRYVAFASSADNLVPNDTNDTADIFIHDRTTGQTTRVSVASNGTQGYGFSLYHAISANGHYIVFASQASNLVNNDTNNNTDIFIHDLVSGQTNLVSIASDGTQANGLSDYPVLSADGQYVVFMSFATNLAVGDSNPTSGDIFVHNRVTGQTSKVSAAFDGSQGNDDSTFPSISSDGRYVAFESRANNLVPGDTNNSADIFVNAWGGGSEVTYSIAGQVTDINGNPQPNVTISDDAGHTVLTNADGEYTLSNLSLGTYSITPSKGEYTFSPASRTVTVPPDSADQNFIGTSTAASSLPVVLVHGWNDYYGSWNTYLEKFLPSIGLTGYAVDNMETGYGGGSLLSIDKNAQRLAEYISGVKRKTGAKQVDIVAHSMGGLIARRYIKAYMQADNPDVNQLIMLGTPNGGSKTADALDVGSIPLELARNLGIPVPWPSPTELTTWSVAQFNQSNPAPSNVKFYAIAGNYSCSPFVKLPSSNSIEPNPDDVVVWRESVFAIAQHGRWTYPAQNTAGCEGDHRGMRSNAVNDGGQVIFSLFVSPLLRGQMPTTPPELQTFASQTDQLQVEGSALQFTDVQTSTLYPSGRLEFSRIPEVAATIGFIVVGQPDQIVVTLRDPDGQVITPYTSDPNVQYMQMDAEYLPITSYTISNPVPGMWTTIVEANTQTSVDGVSVATFGSLVSDLRLTLSVVENTPIVFQNISIAAQLQNGDTPVAGATVIAQVIFPDNTVTPITLLNDSLHGDGNAKDEHYRYQFTPMIPGIYKALIEALWENNGTTFERSAVWMIQVDGYQVFLPTILR